MKRNTLEWQRDYMLTIKCYAIVLIGCLLQSCDGVERQKCECGHH